MGVFYVCEETSRRMISRGTAFAAVEAALVAAVDGSSVSFPSVLGHGGDNSNRFSIKSATTATTGITGVKIGSYWPGNAARGMPRHNSCVLFIDEVTGRVAAVVEAGAVNGFRTAAADAVAANHLARPESSTLALFGAGHQARYELAALREVLPLERVLIVNRDPAKAVSFAREVASLGLQAQVSGPEAACRAADIIVTSTASRAPLFEAGWVRPGTHVASMGSDAAGKQELPPALLRHARLFADLPSQAVMIGECQHVVSEVYAGELVLTAIGDVIRGVAPGRQSPDDITVFDSSGIALQDILVTDIVLREAIAAGKAGRLVAPAASESLDSQ